LIGINVAGRSSKLTGSSDDPSVNSSNSSERNQPNSASKTKGTARSSQQEVAFRRLAQVRAPQASEIDSCMLLRAQASNAEIPLRQAWDSTVEKYVEGAEPISRVRVSATNDKLRRWSQV
jgi:hypothetical protein